MFCSKCGHEQSDANSECLKCGVIFSRISTPAKNKYNCNYRILPAAILVGATILVGVFYCWPNAKNTVRVSARMDADIKEQIGRNMGWGKAPSDAEITLVGLVKGAYQSRGDYRQPVPALKFSIRNEGPSDVPSFGINYSFEDLDNKRKIDGFAVPSGDIKAGWTNKERLYHVVPNRFGELIGGNKPIDFTIKACVWINTESGPLKLYETTYTPEELRNLPCLDWDSLPRLCERI